MRGRLVGAIGFLVIAAGVGVASAASYTAVINDPDGYTNVRNETSKNGEIVARINKGEKFIAVDTGEDWWEVFVEGGKRGYVHKSRIHTLKDEPLPRMSYDRDALLKESKDDEEFKALKVNWLEVVRDALDGSDEGLKRFYGLPDKVSIDGAAGETYSMAQWQVFHIVGDERFSEFLAKQNQKFRHTTSDWLRDTISTYPIEKPDAYLKRYFPETWKLIEKFPKPEEGAGATGATSGAPPPEYSDEKSDESAKKHDKKGHESAKSDDAAKSDDEVKSKRAKSEDEAKSDDEKSDDAGTNENAAKAALKKNLLKTRKGDQ